MSNIFIQKGILSSFLISSLLCFCGNIAFAQKTGKINGNLLDNQQAVEFATVTLAKLPDSTKIVNFTTSDSLGRFTFDNINFGNYLIKIRFDWLQNIYSKHRFDSRNPYN